MQAVLDAGLRLTRLEEHRELEFPFFAWYPPTRRPLHPGFPTDMRGCS